MAHVVAPEGAPYTRLCCRMPTALHREFKSTAVLDGRQMETIVLELVADYLVRRSKPEPRRARQSLHS